MNTPLFQRRPHMDKFMEKVKKDSSGCWLWQGFVQPNGYPFYRHEETTRAHRVSYMLHCGPIPEGLVLDHLCRVKHWVNPDHLEPVTQHVNMQRAKAWTVCAKYHPDEPARWGARGRGGTYCKECQRVRERQRRADARAAGALVAHGDLAATTPDRSAAGRS